MGRPCQCCANCECQRDLFCGARLALCVPTNRWGRCSWCADTDDETLQPPEGAIAGCRPGGWNLTLDGDAAWGWVPGTTIDIPVTFDPDTDRVMFGGGYTPYAGEIFRFYTTSGTLPGGIVANVDHFLDNIVDNTAQVRKPRGGAIVDLTSAGVAPALASRMPSDGNACQLQLQGTAGSAVVLFPVVGFLDGTGFVWHAVETYGFGWQATFAREPGAPIRVWAGFRNGPGILFDGAETHPWGRCTLDANGLPASVEFCTGSWDDSAAAADPQGRFPLTLQLAAQPTIQQGTFVDLTAQYGHGSSPVLFVPVAYGQEYSETEQHYVSFGAEIREPRPPTVAVTSDCLLSDLDTVCEHVAVSPPAYITGGGMLSVPERVLPDAIRVGLISLDRGLGNPVTAGGLLPVTDLEIEAELQCDFADCFGGQGPRDNRFQYADYDTGWVDSGVPAGAGFTWWERIRGRWIDGVFNVYYLVHDEPVGDEFGAGVLFARVTFPLSSFGNFGICSEPLVVAASSTFNGFNLLAAPLPSSLTFEEA